MESKLAWLQVFIYLFLKKIQNLRKCFYL